MIRKNKKQKDNTSSEDKELYTQGLFGEDSLYEGKQLGELYDYSPREWRLRQKFEHVGDENFIHAAYMDDFDELEV